MKYVQKYLQIAKQVTRKGFLVIAIGTNLVLATIFVATFSFYAGQEQGMQTERTEAYGQFGTEVHMLARLIVAEIGGHPNEWPLVLATVLNRVGADQFPDTIEGVVKQLRAGGQGCQFDGMCDVKMERMVTDQGQAAIHFVEANLRAYYAGSYVSPLPGAHSFCVPAACEGAKGYFGQFELLAEHDGHRYFGGRVSKLAVKTSPRPKPRPTDPTAEAIAMAVRLAQE